MLEKDKDSRILNAKCVEKEKVKQCGRNYV